ncbi:MAG: biotin--[acetyl-CoA-carboxylase] ligase [Spirochaetales bacterium]|nr:biotin--[acetyl-CoA-carboxylase] ligase [Spirochaetales bacterium]
MKSLVNPWGGLVRFVERTTSTMDEARVLAASGAPSGSFVWAWEQTKGRGRYPDRRWEARPQDALLTTIFWKVGAFKVPSFAFSLTVALGLVQALEPWAQGGRFAVKWPNDLLFEPEDPASPARKVAGILTAVRREGGELWIHAGIGLNLRRPAGDSFRRPAGAVSDLGLDWSPERALEILLPSLKKALDDPDPRASLVPHLWSWGEPAVWDLPTPEGGRTVEGRIVRLEPTGALVLQTNEGVFTVYSGE